MNTKTNIPTEVQQMYDLWLSGLSIRNVGRKLGVGRMSVWAKLTKYFGKDATNLRKQSLSRVVYQEYGDRDLATRAKGSEGLYRTERVERNYSKCQTFEVAIANLVYSTDEPELEMSLPVYIWIAEMTLEAIASAIEHNRLVALAIRAMRPDCRD